MQSTTAIRINRGLHFLIRDFLLVGDQGRGRLGSKQLGKLLQSQTLGAHQAHDVQVFQFPDIKDEDVDRTRVIILATDNELYGEPFVQLNEATDLCVKYGITCFAAAPEYVVDYDDYERCIKSTGGDLFTLADDDMPKDLINAVEKTDTSVIYKSEKTTTEYPEALVGFLTIALCVHFVATRRVKL